MFTIFQEAYRRLGSPEGVGRQTVVLGAGGRWAVGRGREGPGLSSRMNFETITCWEYLGVVPRVITVIIAGDPIFLMRECLIN